MLRPLAYPLFALIAGIYLGSFSDFELLPFLAGFLVIILGGIILTGKKKWHRASLLLIISFAFVFGLIIMQKQLYFPRNDKHISNFIAPDRITLEGMVSESPAFYPDRNSLTVKCIRIINQKRQYVPAEGNIRLVLPPDLIFEYGDLIRFQAILKKNHSFKNPGGFDYERYLRLRGITATAHIADNSRIVLLRKNTANPFQARLETFRMGLRRMVKQYTPSPAAEIIIAMTLGMKSEIPSAVKDNFARTGTSHLLAISGLHIGMVAAAAFLFFNLLLKSSEYLLLRFNIFKLSTGAAFLLIIIYALLAGMGVTVIRATLMALIFLG
ncbi:MAG TPA: ComEC family competence protein, partial [Smithellaceae bacterium]|nr:ComEC family competence protein [Smithellaceae bacterium]